MTRERDPKLIDGTAIARQVTDELRPRIARLAERGIVPGLVAVYAGDDPASAAYLRGKERASAAAGIAARTLRLPAEISQAALLAEIAALNADPALHGIIVQMPLPAGLDEHAAMLAVEPAKDADGLHPYNLGLLLQGRGVLLPATPSGVQQLLLRSGHEPRGRHVVICGRSNLVGKPLAALLMQRGRGGDATVTVCHTATPDLAVETRRADILVVAAGRRGLIGPEHVKPGAVVIDVGINRIDDPDRPGRERLVGDVDFAAVAPVAGAITPVPGGVGPMTVAMLLVNTVTAAERAGPRPPAPSP